MQKITVIDFKHATMPLNMYLDAYHFSSLDELFWEQVLF